MEPLPGVTAFAAVFDRAAGARLEAAERFVRSLPQLFPRSLVGCDLAWRQGAQILVVIMRFGERRFGAGARRRLEFWCGRAGVRSTDLGKLAAEQRSAFFERIEKCEPKLAGVAPDRLTEESEPYFTRLGAPEGRKLAAAGPVLAMDVGGPGWEGVDYVAVERTFFVPGLLSPPAGDVLTLSLRFPGIERPLESQATVVGVRAEGEAPGTTPGFALALTDPPPDMLEALASRAAAPARHAGAEQRTHPRYAVNMPVLVTPYVPSPEGEEAKDEATEASLEDETPAFSASFPTARIEYATEQELAADLRADLAALAARHAPDALHAAPRRGRAVRAGGGGDGERQGHGREVRAR
jgi:hypothetical protein